MNNPPEVSGEKKTDEDDLAHRTSVFQLACVAAPFVATNMDTTKALLRAKSLLILADAHMNIWRNPTSTVDGFTASEALEEINKRRKDSNLRTWKTIRPLREHLREVVASTTKEDFGVLWKAAQTGREIDRFLIRKIMDRCLKLENAKQEKAAAGRNAKAARRLK